MREKSDLREYILSAILKRELDFDFSDAGFSVSFDSNKLPRLVEAGEERVAMILTEILSSAAKDFTERHAVRPKKDEPNQISTCDINCKPLRWWEYLALVLPRDARERVFENLVDEVIGDWIEHKAKCGSPARLQLLRLMLGFRIAWHFISTVIITGKNGLFGALRELLWQDSSPS